MTATKKPPRPMTARQREVWEYIKVFRDERGYCCTTREIQEHFRWTSTHAVMSHLWPMRRRGYVIWEDGIARTIRIVEVRDGD